MLDECLDSSTNMKDWLLIRWLLQVNLDGGAYLCETHVAGGRSWVRDSVCSKLGKETELINCKLD